MIQTRADALAIGYRMKKSMKSKGWKVKVWNNLGWCVSIYRDYISIHYTKYPNQRATYSCYISDKPDGIGTPYPVAASAFSPEKALKLSTTEVRNYFESSCKTKETLYSIFEKLEKKP